MAGENNVFSSMASRSTGGIINNLLSRVETFSLASCHGFLFSLLGVWALQIEEELIGVGLLQEILAIGEGLDFVELCFHEVMKGLDVSLHPMGIGEDSLVAAIGEGFDGQGVTRRFLAFPA
jgi:hypothetical protein